MYVLEYALLGGPFDQGNEPSKTVFLDLLSE